MSVYSVAKPLPSWVEWCERNSKPKCPRIVREKYVPTRWQTPGPMSKADWKYFYEWAGTRAMPKEPLPEPKKYDFPCETVYLPCARKPKISDPEERAERMIRLSTQLYRKRREKHEYIYPTHPYSPIIVWGQPPLHDKGRPFDPQRYQSASPTRKLKPSFGPICDSKFGGQPSRPGSRPGF